jgi:hypothetical protein
MGFALGRRSEIAFSNPVNDLRLSLSRQISRPVAPCIKSSALATFL